MSNRGRGGTGGGVGRGRGGGDPPRGGGVGANPPRGGGAAPRGAAAAARGSASNGGGRGRGAGGVRGGGGSGAGGGGRSSGEPALVNPPGGAPVGGAGGGGGGADAVNACTECAKTGAVCPNTKETCFALADADDECPCGHSPAKHLKADDLQARMVDYECFVPDIPHHALLNPFGSIFVCRPHDLLRKMFYELAYALRWAVLLKISRADHKSVHFSYAMDRTKLDPLLREELEIEEWAITFGGSTAHTEHLRATFGSHMEIKTHATPHDFLSRPESHDCFNLLSHIKSKGLFAAYSEPLRVAAKHLFTIRNLVYHRPWLGSSNLLTSGSADIARFRKYSEQILDAFSIEFNQLKGGGAKQRALSEADTQFLNAFYKHARQVRLLVATARLLHDLNDLDKLDAKPENRKLIAAQLQNLKTIDPDFNDELALLLRPHFAMKPGAMKGGVDKKVIESAAADAEADADDADSGSGENNRWVAVEDRKGSKSSTLRAEPLIDRWQYDAKDRKLYNNFGPSPLMLGVTHVDIIMLALDALAIVLFKCGFYNASTEMKSKKSGKIKKVDRRYDVSESLKKLKARLSSADEKQMATDIATQRHKIAHSDVLRNPADMKLNNTTTAIGNCIVLSQRAIDLSGAVQDCQPEINFLVALQQNIEAYFRYRRAQYWCNKITLVRSFTDLPPTWKGLGSLPEKSKIEGHDAYSQALANRVFSNYEAGSDKLRRVLRHILARHPAYKPSGAVGARAGAGTALQPSPSATTESDGKDQKSGTFVAGKYLAPVNLFANSFGAITTDTPTEDDDAKATMAAAAEDDDDDDDDFDDYEDVVADAKSGGGSGSGAGGTASATTTSAVGSAAAQVQPQPQPPVHAQHKSKQKKKAKAAFPDVSK